VTNTGKSIHELISNKDAKICVIGLGQVGIPTALTFSKIGFNVIGHDIDKNLLENLNSGKIPFHEANLQNLLSDSIENKKFSTNSNIKEAVENSDIIIVCVATPLTQDVKPDLSALESVCKSISNLVLDNKLVIIESSIPPGTFERLVLPILEKKNNLGKNFWAAFVPERLAPGQAFNEIRTTPRVIGYVDEESSSIAKKLYEKIVESEILETPVRVAEISKLVENTFRDVNVAFANEVGLICERYGIDSSELVKVCNSHPRVNLLQPGPGVGGPCLPKDPYLLLNPQNGEPIESKIILQARKINDNMPSHVVDLISNLIEDQNKKLDESTILVLGVAYKGNISDARFSPSKEIISKLIKNGSKILVYDPISTENFGGERISDLWKALGESDVLVVVTDHDEFKNLDLTKIKKTMKNPAIVDTRRVFDLKLAENLGIKYLAVGYGGKLRNK